MGHATIGQTARPQATIGGTYQNSRKSPARVSGTHTVHSGESPMRFQDTPGGRASPVGLSITALAYLDTPHGTGGNKRAGSQRLSLKEV
jgi:hypothetical protein